MTAQLALDAPTGPGGDEPPGLLVHGGRPVSWGEWAPAGPCPVCTRPSVIARGAVRERRRAVPPRLRGFAFAACPDVYEVGALWALGGCSCALVVVDVAAPGWSWSPAGEVPAGRLVRAREVGASRG